GLSHCDRPKVELGERPSEFSRSLCRMSCQNQCDQARNHEGYATEKPGYVVRVHFHFGRPGGVPLYKAHCGRKETVERLTAGPICQCVLAAEKAEASRRRPCGSSRAPALGFAGSRVNASAARRQCSLGRELHP